MPYLVLHAGTCAAASSPAIVYEATAQGGGGFSSLLAKGTVCASPDDLKDFQASVVSPKTHLSVSATVVFVCSTNVLLSVSGIPAGEVPEGGQIQKKSDTSKSVPLVSQKLKPSERNLMLKGDFKSLLDKPPACATGKGYQAYLTLPNRSLVAATVTGVCPGWVALDAAGLSEDQEITSGVLLHGTKPPVIFGSGTTTSGAGGQAGKIYGSDGDFTPFVGATAPCISGTPAKDFSAYLTVQGQPIVTGTVVAVCPGKAFVATSNVPDGATPTAELIVQKDNSKAVEVIFDVATYQYRMASVAPSDLQNLCDPVDCSKAKSSDIDVVLAPAAGSKKGAGAPRHSSA